MAYVRDPNPVVRTLLAHMYPQIAADEKMKNQLPCKLATASIVFAGSLYFLPPAISLPLTVASWLVSLYKPRNVELDELADTNEYKLSVAAARRTAAACYLADWVQYGIHAREVDALKKQIKTKGG